MLYKCNLYKYTMLVYIKIYVYINIYIYVYTYVYTFVYVKMNTYIYMCIYMCIYIYIYIHKCIYIYIYLMYVCMYIYIYTYVNNCKYTYTYTCVCAQSLFRQIANSPTVGLSPDSEANQAKLLNAPAFKGKPCGAVVAMAAGGTMCNVVALRQGGVCDFRGRSQKLKAQRW